MIYFDNAATYHNDNKATLEVYLEANQKYFANANSSHRLGYLANKAVDQARLSILRDLKLDSNYEVIFNSGATEGINHALKGYALRNKSRGNEIIAFKNEHPAVSETLLSLSKLGFKITYIDCDKNGEINYAQLKSLINQNTIMVVVMSVNNETGATNNLDKIYDIVKTYPKCVFFSDVTQAIGKINLNYHHLDIFAFSAHKFGGLMGSGILIKKKKILLTKLIDGGAQENNLRAGTLASPLAISTSFALHQAITHLDGNLKHVLKLKDCLIEGLKKNPEIILNSSSEFPYIVNFSLKSKKASVLLEALSNKEIYVSSQSACHAKSNIVSSVLLNMGLDRKLAENSVRVSFSEVNTIDEVRIFLRELNEILGEIR
ncbi:MAG: cysteine desulfurase [Bacilli bacterium]|nr:cysteine desulfurase [Bacilli bacterium]